MQFSKSLRCSLALQASVLQYPLRNIHGYTYSFSSSHLGHARRDMNMMMMMRPKFQLQFMSTSISTKRSTRTRTRTFATQSEVDSGSESEFIPPKPPSFQGEPVFPDINININDTRKCSEDAIKRNQDPDAVFVVTGASRGIGLQIVKELMHRTKGKIVACCRSPAQADKLQSYIQSIPEVQQQQRQRISIQQLDLEDQTTIDQLAKTIQSSPTLQKRVDVLYNVAGLLGDGRTTPGPERAIRSIDRDWATKSMAVNCIGPMCLSQALAPMMRINVKKDTHRGKSVICNLSARVGSISDNGLGGWISYRSSKSALNQVTRTMAHELKRQGTMCISLHPGTTDTDLSRPFQANVRQDRLFPVTFTAGRMIDAVDCMEEEHSGGLFDWSGTALPF